MSRLENLRNLAVRPVIDRTPFNYYFYKCYKNSTHFVTEDKFAEACIYSFSNVETPILDGEIIVGNSTAHLSPEQQKEWDEEYCEYAHSIVASFDYGQDSHLAVDYDLVLNKGLCGIIKRIDGYLEECEEIKKPFYNSCKAALNAVIKYSENYSEHAKKLAESEQNGERKKELLEISEVCKRVPAYPAESFHEAVQAVHFITHCLSANPFMPFRRLQYQFGRPDRYLYPFYKKDIEDGKITKEYAQLLLDLLGIQINMRVPAGLSSGYMVGGKDENGNIVANELTEMCMQVIDDIRLVYPSVGLCVCDGYPEEYLKKACEILSHGRSHPAIFNDDIIAKGLMYYGIPEKDSRNYIHSTCVEITPIASSNVWVASPYTNMPQKLLDIMNRDYESFDELLSAYFDSLSQHIGNNFKYFNDRRIERAKLSVNPLLSCLVNDCLERGLDIEKGGGRYNWVMPSFVGVPNVVDSLYAINRLIFEDREMSVTEYKTILDGNFEGHEELRNKILNKFPKYGNDNDEVDALFEKVKSFIVKECEKYNGVFSEGRLIPSVFCWVMHERFGRDTGATPDGRVAGFPLADGSGPCQGREKCGPTASVLSSTKWSHAEMIGGVAVNMKFSKASFTSESYGNMLAIIKAFLQRGGFEMQINVTDRETLEKARQNPEEYRDLVVRIGGYSDYFTNISPQMQAEVILRTEHGV